jgi:hypothetical protein
VPADFSRDFGYLDKFLSNLANHAATLPEPQGSRLKQLMAEETARWAEVKRLLAGEAPSAPTTAPAVAPAAPTPSPAPEARAAAPAGLTVGSLLGQPKK